MTWDEYRAFRAEMEAHGSVFVDIRTGELVCRHEEAGEQ